MARSSEGNLTTGDLGVSEAMLQVEDTLVRVVDLDLPVLILGETGVGKEVAARCRRRHRAR